MTICLFAGCGNSTTPTPESTPTPEASTPTPDATTPTPDATPTPTPTPTPSLPPVEDLIIGYEISNIDEANKTATLCGIKLLGWPEIASDEVRKAITELKLPGEVDGYTIIELSWDVMGQSKYQGSIGFCGGEGLPDCYVKKLTIPASVKKIQYFAFGFCGAIEEVIFEGDPNEIEFSDNVFGTIPYVNNAVNKNNGYFVVGGNLQYGVDWGDIVIPDGVRIVGDRIWEYQRYTDSDAGTYLGITSITIPEGVEHIGKDLVRDDMDVEWIYIPASVTSIDDSAICYPETMDKPATIVKTVKGSYAEAWAKEKGYNYEIVGGQVEFDYEYQVISEDEKTAILRTIILPDGMSKDEVRELTLPSTINGYTVVGIGWDVFGRIHDGGLADDNWLEKVTIPGTVEFFENDVFRDAYGCTTIIFEDESKITRIDDRAFRNTPWEKDNAAETGVSMVNGIVTGIYDYGDVVIPEGAVAISGRPFQDAGDGSSVTSITIPSTVKVISKLMESVNPDAVIKCEFGSYAEQYAKDNGIKYEYINGGAEQATVVNASRIYGRPNLSGILDANIWGNPAIHVDRNSYNAALYGHNATPESSDMDIYLVWDETYIYIGVVSPDADPRGDEDSWEGDGIQFKICAGETMTGDAKNIYFTLGEDKTSVTIGSNEDKCKTYAHNVAVKDGFMSAVIAIPMADLGLAESDIKAGAKLSFSILRISATSEHEYAGWLAWGAFFGADHQYNQGCNVDNTIVLSDEAAESATVIAAEKASGAVDVSDITSWGDPAIHVDKDSFNAALYQHNATPEESSMDIYAVWDEQNLYIGVVSPDTDPRGDEDSWEGDGIQFKICAGTSMTAEAKNIYFTLDENKSSITIGSNYDKCKTYAHNVAVKDGFMSAAIAIPLEDLGLSASDIKAGAQFSFSILRISATSEHEYAGWLAWGAFFGVDHQYNQGCNVDNIIVLVDAD